MSLMQIDFFSDVLGREVAVNAVIPQGNQSYKTLYLLHGLSDNHTAWQRYTRVEQFASWSNVALVMPNCDRSFYTDMAQGDRYFTFLTDELPKVMREFFRGMSAQRDDNFIAGLSMGGYGAFKAALTYPERYAAACSLSGALDISFMISDYGVADSSIFRLNFGSPESFEGGENDLFALLKKDVAEEKRLPELFFSCGTEDAILPCSRRFRDACSALGVKADYTEGPGGHNWTFWNERIEPFISYIGQYRK